MRITDLLVENKVTEAPMGMLSKLGNTVASNFGSGKAAGRLDTGNAANQLKQSFMKYLGQTGQEAEPDAVIAFLKQQGYPTDGAARALNAPAKPGIIQKAAGAVGGAVKNVAKGVADVAKGAVAGAQAATAQPQTAPAAQAAPAGRPQGGGKVAGQQSQTPGAVAKRNARRDAKNAAATTGGAGAFNQMAKQVTTPQEPAQQATAAVQGTANPAQPPVKKKKIVKAGVYEALSGQQLDAAFLAAVQDKAKGAVNTAPAGDANKPVKATAKGTFAALGRQGRGPRTLKDNTGKIPENIMAQLNQISEPEREKLIQYLGAK